MKPSTPLESQMEQPLGVFQHDKAHFFKVSVQSEGYSSLVSNQGPTNEVYLTNFQVLVRPINSAYYIMCQSLMAFTVVLSAEACFQRET